MDFLDPVTFVSTLRLSHTISPVLKLLSSGLTSLFLPPTLRLKPKTQSLLKKINSIDWVGCFLLVASSISFLIAVSWGGIQFEWSAPQTLVPLFLGAAGISAFVIWEQLGTSQPVLPIRIFCNRTSATVLWHSMVTGLTIWSGLYYLPVYFQGVKGYSPLGSAVALFPLTLTLPPFAVLFGILIKKTGQYRKFLWLGWLLATLGAGLFILLDLDTSRAQWTFNTMFAGIGLGILLPVLRVAVQASSSNEDMAFAASLVMTTRVLGMSLAIGVCGIIFQNVFRLKVQGPAFSNRADALSKDALGVVNLIQQLSDADPDKVVLRRALGDSIRFVWVFLAAMSGFSLFTSFFTRELSLHRNLETDQGVEHGAAFEMAIEPKLTADWIVTECRLAAIASKEANNEQKEFDC
jgi:hypothetical protein